jgi:hypothetical protein
VYWPKLASVWLNQTINKAIDLACSLTDIKKCTLVIDIFMSLNKSLFVNKGKILDSQLSWSHGHTGHPQPPRLSSLGTFLSRRIHYLIAKEISSQY